MKTQANEMIQRNKSTTLKEILPECDKPLKNFTFKDLLSLHGKISIIDNYGRLCTSRLEMTNVFREDFPLGCIDDYEKKYIFKQSLQNLKYSIAKIKLVTLQIMILKQKIEGLDSISSLDMVEHYHKIEKEVLENDEKAPYIYKDKIYTTLISSEVKKLTLRISHLGELSSQKLHLNTEFNVKKAKDYFVDFAKESLINLDISEIFWNALCLFNENKPYVDNIILGMKSINTDSNAID